MSDDELQHCMDVVEAEIGPTGVSGFGYRRLCDLLLRERAAARRDERERCARVCEEHAKRSCDWASLHAKGVEFAWEHEVAARNLAAAIRALGDAEEKP